MISANTFPKLLAERCVEAGLDLKSDALSYSIESTPHRAQRILFLDASGETVAVCQWANGERRVQLERSHRLCAELADRHPALGAHLPAPLFLEQLGLRLVQGRKWVAGSTLSLAMGREKCLEDALQLLLKFQLATRVDASFDEQIIADYVDLPIEEFRRLTPHKTAFHEQLEHIQRRLHGHRDTAMPLCLVHGDYEFVNILKPDSGDLCLLDWESATLRGPGLMDLAHLLIAYAVHAMDMNYDQAARALYLRDGDLYAFASRYLSEYEQRFDLARSLRPAFLAMNIVGGLSRLLSRLPFKASDPLWSEALLTARDILDEADSSATQDAAEPAGSV